MSDATLNKLISDLEEAAVLPVSELVKARAAIREYASSALAERDALRAELAEARNRIAELERDERDHIETQYNVGVALGWPEKKEGVPDTAWDDKPKLSVAVKALRTELAEARAVIELFVSARMVNERTGQESGWRITPTLMQALDAARAFLAKEQT